MNATFLSPDDPAWASILAHVPHDVFHLPAYSQVLAAYDEGQAVAFYAEHGDAACLMPFVRRPVKASFPVEISVTDLQSPYGYSPPLFTPDVPPRLGHEIMRTFVEMARQEHIVSAFIRMHPLLAPADETVLTRFGVIVRHADTVFIDLIHRSLADVERHAHRHRGDIRHLRASGFSVVFDGWHDLDAFGHLYRQTMERVGASAFHRFPATFFETLHRALSDRLHLTMVYAPDGEPASGILFTSCGELVGAFLAGTSHRYHQLSPSKLAYLSLCEWALDHAYRYVHLGGGVGSKADSLFWFKTGFSDLARPFHTYRMILHSDLYVRLSGSQDAGDGFFPAYRTPRVR